MRNLILTGGIRHDFADNTEAVVALLLEVGIESVASEDIDAGILSLAREAFDLVTVMALRWPMAGDAKYAPYRTRWGYHMPEESRWTLQHYVDGGGGLFGLHTACLCFDDWDEWRQLLGGAWSWGRSFHPPRGPVMVEPTAARHALTRGLPEFSVEDEVFSALSLAEGVEPLMTARPAGGADGQPVVWARRYGAGRVAYDALGHDRSSLETESHRRLVQRCALWAGGSAEDILAAI